MSSALDVLTDACVGLPVRIQKMFGGHGFFAPNGGMFAGILSDHEAMLKLVDEGAREELIAAGGRPWVYDGKGKPVTMASWIVVPESFFDDQEAFSAWARRAHALVPPKKVTTKRAPKKAEAPATTPAPKPKSKAKVKAKAKAAKLTSKKPARR